MARLSYRVAFLAALVVVPLAVDTSIHEQTELPKRTLAALIAWVLAGVWFLGGAWRRDYQAPGAVTPWRMPALALLFGFLAWCVVATAAAPHPERSVEPLLLVFGSILWLVLGWWAAEARWCRLGALIAVAVAGLVTAAVGLFQYGVEHPAAFPFGFEPLDRLLARLRDGGIWSGFGRLDQTDVPGSLFGHANVAAELVAMAIPAAALAATAVFVAGRGVGRVLTAVPAVFLAAVVAASVLFVVRSGSRAALLAVAAAGGVLWLYYVCDAMARRPVLGSRAVHALVHVLILVVVAAGATLALDSLRVSPRHGQHATTALRRLSSSLSPASTTVRERLDLWANTLDMVADHPLTGVGPGGFAVAYPRYAASRRQHESGRLSLRRQPEKPHNEMVHAAAEAGWPGAGLWTLAVGAVLAGGAAGLLRRGTSRSDRLVMLGCLGALVVVLVVAMVSFPMRQTATRVGFWALAGLMLRTASRASPRSSRPALVRTGIAVGLCALAFAVTFSHYRARYEASRAVRSYGQLVAMEGMLDGVRPRVLLEQLRALDRAAARVPSSYRYELMRAQVLRRLGRPREAARAYRRCLELHPDLINAHVGLAQSLIDVGDVDGARAAAKDAARLNPRESRARMMLGRVNKRLGRIDRALRDYALALELEPSTPDRLQIHLDVAAIQIDRDPVLAARHLQTAFGLAPGDPRVLEAQARFLERQSPGSQHAMEAWMALLQVAPDHVDAKIHVARSFLAARQFEAALSLLDEAWAARGDLAILYDRARALSGLGRLLEARDSLRECMNRCARTGNMALWTRCRELLLPIEEALARSRSQSDGEDE